MIPDTTFFSYSRTDSAFVLKLANDLRDAGIKIWLDQLDIKPGTHWDEAIETALNTASHLLLILSPAAVASDNVMDEVSFALDTDRTVIPVLLTECKTPFRLRRLQHIDFTGDYKTGLNRLIGALRLSVEQQPREAQVHDANSRPESADNSTGKHVAHGQPGNIHPQPGTEMRPVENSSTLNQPVAGNGQKRKYLLWAAGVIVLCLAAWGALQFTGRSKPGTGSGKIHKVDPLLVAANNGQINTDSLKKVQMDSLRKVKDSIAIGKKFRGGIIFYIDSSDGPNLHGLIAAPYDQSTNVGWNNSGSKVGAYGTDIGEGKANTRMLVTKLGEGTYPAKLCADLAWKGYTDWYLPSRDELKELYGKREIVGGFTDNYYWSSSEDFNADTWYQSFFSGRQFKKIDRNKACVRAIRSF